jgi:hypothetical protein
LVTNGTEAMIILHQIHLGDQIQKNMGRAHSKYGGEDRCVQGWWGDLMEKQDLEELGVDGRIILKRIFKMWGGKAWNGLIWLWTGTCTAHL